MSALLNTPGVARRSAKITPAIDIHSLPDDALVRRDLVLQLFGYSRTTLWRRIRAKQPVRFLTELPTHLPARLRIRLSAIFSAFNTFSIRNIGNI